MSDDWVTGMVYIDFRERSRPTEMSRRGAYQSMACYCEVANVLLFEWEDERNEIALFYSVLFHPVFQNAMRCSLSKPVGACHFF